MSSEERARWSELTQELFGQDHPAGRRRSYRLPCDARARLEADGGSFECEVISLSHLGLTLAGAGARALAGNTPVTVRSIGVGGELVELELECRTVPREGGGAGEVGLSIAFLNAPGARARYFDRVYYPAYLAYLRARAAGEG